MFNWYEMFPLFQTHKEHSFAILLARTSFLCLCSTTCGSEDLDGGLDVFFGSAVFRFGSKSFGYTGVVMRGVGRVAYCSVCRYPLANPIRKTVFLHGKLPFIEASQQKERI